MNKVVGDGRAVSGLVRQKLKALSQNPQARQELANQLNQIRSNHPYMDTLDQIEEALKSGVVSDKEFEMYKEWLTDMQNGENEIWVLLHQPTPIQSQISGTPVAHNDLGTDRIGG